MRYLSRRTMRTRSKFRDFDTARALDRKRVLNTYGGLRERSFKQNIGKIANRNFDNINHTYDTREKVLKKIENLMNGRVDEYQFNKNNNRSF